MLTAFNPTTQIEAFETLLQWKLTLCGLVAPEAMDTVVKTAMDGIRLLTLYNPSQ